MRMIDADIVDVVIIYDKTNELKPASEVREYIKRQKAFLDKFPTIDAVPVVRCRDCKYHEDTSVIGFGHCCLYDLTMRYNDFCSYGKREGGAD